MNPRRIAWFALISLVLACTTHARDWYVSASRGSGKAGTKDAPAKDLGNIADQLQEGDRVLIAGGTYLGRAECGSDIIAVPVQIYGGWDDQFTRRDPWGASRTILSGVNQSKNWTPDHRLDIDLSKRRQDAAHQIVVDGLIIDNAGRNHYGDEKQTLLVRRASARGGHNPSPETAGLRVGAGKRGDIIVRNCVVMNAAPTVGAFSIWGNQASKVLIENNLAINNTGVGFALHTLWVPRDGADMPVFTFRYNTSLFNEKHDPIATYGGSALMIESMVKATNNVLAFNDYYGVNNAKNFKGIVMNNNLFAGNVMADYLEFNTKIDATKLADDANSVAEAQGNVVQPIKVPVSQEWAAAYMARNVIDRNAAEADVKAAESHVNDIRAMLGLPLQAGELKADSSAWLPRMSIDDALSAGKQRYDGKYGCQQPAAGSIEPAP